MSIKLSIVICLCFFVLIPAACSDKNSTGAVGTGDFVKVYPNAIGMSWTYTVHDSLLHTTDTFLVSVLDTAIIQGSTRTMYWKLYSPYSDSLIIQYAGSKGDTLLIFRGGLDTTLVEIFPFPLTQGKKWAGPYDNPYTFDTSTVTETGSISTPAGTFGNASKIQRGWDFDFEGGGRHSETWIAPDVGMVRQNITVIYSDGANIDTSRNETWELIDYNLSTFSISDFPLHIGNTWQYEVFDSLNAIYDTIDVTAEGMATIAFNLSAYRLIYTGGAQPDTDFVVINWDDDEIDIYTYEAQPYPYYTYHFPFAMGDGWGIYTFAELTGIVGKGTITVPAGTFDDGFFYTAEGSIIPNDFYRLENWLVPGVGLVKMTKTEYWLAPENIEVWRLLDYDIAD